MGKGSRCGSEQVSHRERTLKPPRVGVSQTCELSYFLTAAEGKPFTYVFSYDPSQTVVWGKKIGVRSWHDEEKFKLLHKKEDVGNGSGIEPASSLLPQL